MQIADLLTSKRIVCGATPSSKKRTLELVSELFSDVHSSLTQNDIFNGLVARERLGSTGLGHGVAIPHGRFKFIQQAALAVIRFRDSVDFDAVDGQPVDLVFALMVPENSTEEHLELLAAIAGMLRNPVMRERLRQAQTPEEIEAVIQDYHPRSPEQAASSA